MRIKISRNNMSILQNLKHEHENKTNKINMTKSALTLLLLKH